MSEKPATEFEVEKRYSAGEFGIHADRRQSAFVGLHCGLSHKGGHIQWILKPEMAKKLAEELLKAAEFCSYKTLSERYPKKREEGPDEIVYGTTLPGI